MDDRIPLIVFGDGPRNPTGLGRIARDLALRLHADADDLGIRLLQVGVDSGQGWHWQPWDFFGFQPVYKDFGRGAMESVVSELRPQHDRRPVVLAIFDPARIYDLTRPIEGPMEEVHLHAALWGYFPIDAHTPNGSIGGPAAEAVWDVDRVLAYGPYGASVLKKTLTAREPAMGGTPTQRGVQWLPHGIDTRIFCPRPLAQADPVFQRWHGQVKKGSIVVGCVATNQPRKDFGLVFATIADIQNRGLPIALWIHTDILTNVWDFGELATQFALRRDQVLVTLGELPDTEIAARYSASDVTIAPGLGEGFGFPIVESLSCGTPVVHGRYAGGAALIPEDRWLVEPEAWRLESIYALLRPVLQPGAMADALLDGMFRRRERPDETIAYCRGAVQYLDWEWVWPAWRSWIRKGLRDERDRHDTQPLARHLAEPAGDT